MLQTDEQVDEGDFRVAARNPDRRHELWFREIDGDIAGEPRRGEDVLGARVDESRDGGTCVGPDQTDRHHRPQNFPLPRRIALEWVPPGERWCRRHGSTGWPQPIPTTSGSSTAGA